MKARNSLASLLRWLTLALLSGMLLISLHQCFSPNYQTIADIEDLTEEWVLDINSHEEAVPDQDKAPAIALEPTPHRGQRIGSFRISSPWGMRYHPISGDRRPHRGVDVAMREGTPYYFAGQPGTTGKVRCFFDRGGGGFIAQMISNDPRYKGIFLELLHLQKSSCRPGFKKAGDRIGRVGSTGRSTGAHAHFQTVRVRFKDGRWRRIHFPPSATPLREIVKK